MDGLCFDDMSEFGLEIDDPLEELWQDKWHELLEAPGSNPDDRSRGVGLVAALSGTSKDVAALRLRAEAAMRDDDRINDARVNIQETDTRGSYRVDLTLAVGDAILTRGVLIDGVGNVRPAP